MNKHDDDISADGILGFAILLVIIGLACAAYRYAPFYGATPLTVGACILALPVIDRIFRR